MRHRHEEEVGVAGAQPLSTVNVHCDETYGGRRHAPLACSDVSQRPTTRSVLHKHTAGSLNEN